ncbi:uncharacterized protein LOC112001096 [Quercus suber]|uniref:uncharacterized protein LOC112001096 n=1 Tax=Quercus suber TaxID=58331 RepID=UPI000CE26D16|nr:uncharacterized protein LOC112001096 [Quercus suber]
MAVNHFPSVMIITETRIGGDRATRICEDLPFDGFFVTDTIGYAEGLWLQWKKEKVDIFMLSSTEQEIHATVKLLLGDFNEVLSSEDKFGGRNINLNRALDFKECLDSCSLLDLGFSGPKFTWSNLRQVSDLILDRIDRCFANPSWRLLYPEASVTHLPRVFSDHCLVLLELSKAPPASINRPFCFQTMWLHHPGFLDVVREAWEHESILSSAIKLFTNKATLWNKTMFGNLFARKRRLLARINGT